MKVTALATISLTLLLAGCAIGDRARELDIRRDLSGLDRAYLEKRSTDTHTDNSQSIEGRLSGWPFWFAPVVSLRYAGNNALHRGEVVDDESEQAAPRAPISGFEHSSGSAYGIGILHYHTQVARWDQEGDLEQWRDSYGFGWGLVYSSREWGDGTGRTGLSAKILGGLLGYSETGDKGHLHLLWVPLPF